MSNRSLQSHGGAQRATSLVVCIGNELRGDDAFGPRIAARLSAAQLPSHADLVVHRGDALSLLETFRGYERVILVDAIAVDRPAGTLFWFEVSSAKAPLELKGTSTHALGPAGAVELARALGELPPRVEIVAVAGKSFTLGAALCDELASRVDAVAERIPHVLRQDTQDPNHAAPSPREVRGD